MISSGMTGNGNDDDGGDDDDDDDDSTFDWCCGRDVSVDGGDKQYK